MSGQQRRPSERKPSQEPRTRFGRYLRATQSPLCALIFLFPLVATYEFGTLILHSMPGRHEQLVAYGLLHRFLSLFGANSSWLPGVALVLTLVIWHMMSRKPWHINGWVLPGMAAESALLALPLLLITRILLQATTAPNSNVFVSHAVLAIGAGIYEELLFRLYLISGCVVLFADVIGLPRKSSLTLAIIIPALLFAGCHVRPIGAEVFEWAPFVCRVAAGLYLSAVYLSRGFGIAVGAHAAHNLLLLWMDRSLYA
jgi:hypothetical protein